MTKFINGTFPIIRKVFFVDDSVHRVVFAEKAGIDYGNTNVLALDPAVAILGAHCDCARGIFDMTDFRTGPRRRRSHRH